MLGKIVVDDMDPPGRTLTSGTLSQSKCGETRLYPGSGQKKVILVDFGMQRTASSVIWSISGGCLEGALELRLVRRDS